MKFFILIGFVQLLFLNTGCKENFINKNRYDLTIGESVEIYYSTNSCCYYCILKKDKLKSIRLVERKIVDKGPDDCEGCNYTGAFVFKAVSVGVDTIILNYTTATGNCKDSADGDQEIFIVKVQ
jgi:hypothetical protein